MEYIKRSRSDINHDYDESKRPKLSITTAETKHSTEESISVFEDLSNELVYEIFEFLDFHQAYQSFYNLNSRFRNLFVYSNLPIKINISSISKSAFHRYLTHIITPHTDRIQSLRLSNPFAADMSLLLLPLMANFTRLETLIINNIEADYIEPVVNHLSSLPVLSLLVITSNDYIKNQNEIYQKIFRLSGLKYCQLSIETRQRLYPLSFSTNGASPIEHLVINNTVSLHQLASLLSYVPLLHRLSFGRLDGSRGSRTHKSSISVTHLTDVSLKLYSVNFNDLESLVTEFFCQVQILRIVICLARFSSNGTEYLNANRWERLISTHMANLTIFDFQHQYCVSDYNDDRAAYEVEVNKFNSVFWTKRRWFFEHQYYGTRWRKAASFYSTNPYRRKDYILYGDPKGQNCSCGFALPNDPIDHVYIQNTNAMKKFLGIFPNATKLTLSETFNVPRDSIVNDLNRIIPLRQLTKLTLDCHRLPFDRMIQLLYFTPSIHTLKLDSILLYGTDSFSIQQTEVFRVVSDANIVTNVTIENECTLEKIQLLTALFPRLEYLIMNLNKEDLESIVRFLLSKFNDYTRYLSSLCISKRRRDLVQILKNLLETEDLLQDYTMKVIDRQLYLWW